MTELIIWSSGLLSGLAVGFAFHQWQMHRVTKAVQKFVEEQANIIKTVQRETVQVAKSTYEAQGRLDRAMAIVQEQAALVGQLDSPSKSASHSKHKNSIVRQIKQLEEEKVKLLREVLDSGFDPDVTVIDEKREKQSMKLSTYLEKQGHSPTPDPTPTDPNPPKGKPTLRRIK